MGSNTQVPARADFRFIQKVMQALLGGKVEQVPKEFDLVSRVFVKAGGSWEKIFLGSPDNISLLKRIIKLAYKKRKLTKKYQWDVKKSNDQK